MQNAEYTGYDIVMAFYMQTRKAVKPPGFYRRLNILSTADSECAARCVRSTRLRFKEDDELPDGCFEVDRVVAKQASVVSACTVSD